MADNKMLIKQMSWSPDIHRDIEWEKLKMKQRRRYHRSKNMDNEVKSEVTDEDMKELKACFDLGFGFDSFSDLDPKLSKAFPALEMYAAVNRQYNSRNLSRCSSLSSDSSSSSSLNHASPIIDPSDDPQKMKTKLKQWAQLVSCSIIEASSPKITKKHYKKTN